MLCGNKNIGFSVISACQDCKLYQRGNRYKLSELIPEGHCLELLHSLLPYMLTFKHGGWFKWERMRNRVVVCCPSVNNNVCVELKKDSESGELRFMYRVLKIRGICRFYGDGKVMEINEKDFRTLCWSLFNIIFPYLRTEHHKINITCGRESHFELFKIEDL